MEQPTMERTGIDVPVGLRSIHVEEAGHGTPVVVLHHSTGPFWTPFYDRLAEHHRVVAPDLPGYGRSERPPHARQPRDLAIACLQLLTKLDLDAVHLVGLGLGGWIAAEMATMAANRLSSLVLVGPDGIRPRVGEIADPMLDSFVAQAKLAFSTDERFVELFGEEPAPELIQLWDLSREMTARITWRPWMWSLQLPDLLRAVDVPALVVYGDHDRVVPLDCGTQYAELLPDARLVLLPTAGHAAEVERPDELAALIGEFLAAKEATAAPSKTAEGD